MVYIRVEMLGIAFSFLQQNAKLANPMLCDNSFDQVRFVTVYIYSTSESVSHGRYSGFNEAVITL